MHVLYATQTGLAEPLARSQVIPYLRGLAALGHRFTVLSFEREDDLRSGRSMEAARLLPEGSRWVSMTYHRRPPLLATAYDVARGVARASFIPSVDILHGRSTVPALMVACINVWSRVPWIFDIRGFVAQEYVDVGHWQPKSRRARVTACLEQHLIRRASGRVFLTRRARAQMEGCVFPEGAPTAVIPCAVDFERFAFSAEARAARREELGVRGEALLEVYAGSLGNWNLAPELLAFHRVLRETTEGARLLILTRDLDVARREADRSGLSSSVVIRSATPDEVPGYLSAADMGLAFATSRPSRLASSPTKIAEYLACGLPVVTNSGVGDIEDLEGETPVVIAAAFDEESLARAAVMATARLRLPGIRSTARTLAASHFSLESATRAYDRLYRSVREAR